MGRKDDAKRVLTIALTEAPESARIAAYLGMVQLSGGDTAAPKNPFMQRWRSIQPKRLP